MTTEAEARDGILDRLEVLRADAVALARIAADEVYRERGRVTSVETLARMREQGHGDLLDTLGIPYWIGCVFRKGWERVGWVEGVGSHGRPVAVWVKREGGG